MDKKCESPVRAECDWSQSSLPTIKAFWLGETRFEVVVLIDRWIGQDYWYFKVKVPKSDVYILRYSLSLGEWEINLYCREAYLSGEYSTQQVNQKRPRPNMS